MTDSIAIAHKDYDTRGGGEVFVRRLAQWLDCPVYVGRRNQANEPDDADLDIREIPLSAVEKRCIDHGGLPRSVAYMSAWSKASGVLSAFDTVITSGNEPMWYVAEDEQTHIAYTHSTPRFMYDLFARQTNDMSLLGAGFNIVKRTAYQHNTARPDLWIANSDRVARRIERYHHVDGDDIRVVYPPVDVDNYSPGDAPTQNYYVHLGRLAGHKRVGELVEAFNGLDQRLIIAGTGPEADRLQEMAAENIEFEGFVSETRKRDLLAGAKAQVYAPENEDFGMVPIESMAAGTPVISVDEGFQSYQIRDGVNGLLFDRGTESCRRAVRRFERDGVKWDSQTIAAFAAQFGREPFREGMRAAIADAQARATVTTDIEFEGVDREPVSVRADGGES